MGRPVITVLIEQKVSADPARVELLREQIRKAGIEPEVLYRVTNAQLVARVARAAAVGPVALVDSSFVASQATVSMLLERPWTTHSCVVVPDRAPAFETAIQVDGRRVVSSGTEYHRVTAPTHRGLGFVRIAPGRATVQTLLGATDYADQQVLDLDGVALVTLLLVRSDAEVQAMVPTGPALRTGGSVSQEIRDIASRDEDALRLEQATRANDGFYSTFVLRKLSKQLTRLAIKRGWSPNQITITSLAIALIAAIEFAHGTRASLAIGAVLVQLAIIVDCSDGEVARYTGVSSRLGAWLDAATDRIKEYALYAGLATGAHTHTNRYWATAMALVVMQTVRHLADYNFVAIRGRRERRDASLPLAQAVDRAPKGGGGILGKSASLNSRRAVHWTKRVIYLPIGERWLLISVGAALGSPKLVFGLLAATGLFGLTYVLVGRFLRSRRWTSDVSDTGCDIVERQVDAGPLAQLVIKPGTHPLRGKYGWFVPSFLRFLELGAVAVVGHNTPFAYLWIFAVAYHHYDTMYRSLEGIDFPTSLATLGLGVEVRLILVGLISLMPWPSAVEVAFFIGGWYFAVLFIGIASVRYARELQRAR